MHKRHFAKTKARRMPRRIVCSDDDTSSAPSRAPSRETAAAVLLAVAAASSPASSPQYRTRRTSLSTLRYYRLAETVLLVTATSPKALARTCLTAISATAAPTCNATWRKRCLLEPKPKKRGRRLATMAASAMTAIPMRRRKHPGKEFLETSIVSTTCQPCSLVWIDATSSPQNGRSMRRGW